MKKLLTSVLVLGTLASLGAAFAQATESHDVTILIPAMLGVRIVNSAGAHATNPAVTFDYQTDPTAYINTVNAGGGDLLPTGVTQFANLQVLYNAGGWTLSVAAASTGITYTDNLGLNLTTAGIALADISATATGTAGPGVDPVSSFDLTGGTFASGTNTGGWSNIGLSGNDYRLHVNGDENPGQYSTTVTFTLAAL